MIVIESFNIKNRGIVTVVEFNDSNETVRTGDKLIDSEGNVFVMTGVEHIRYKEFTSEETFRRFGICLKPAGRFPIGTLKKV